jgi:hypothetical protein
MRLSLTVLFLGMLTTLAVADDAPRADTAHGADEPAAGTVGVSAGAGMNGFVGGDARGVIGPGVGWEVRITTLDNRHVRAELSYIGSTQNLVEDTSIALRSHGIQGALRVNVMPEWRIEPFVYLGAGWARLSVTNNAGGTFTSPDNVLDMPFGLGAAYHIGTFVIDVRGAISVVTGAQIVEVMETMDDANMNRFSVRASVGVEL